MSAHFYMHLRREEVLPGQEAGMKHKVTINVTDENGRSLVLRGAKRRLPTRLVRWLFGGYTQIYLLSPGKTVQSVDIKEV